MPNNAAQTPLISVIVPVYNVENYLNDCVSSICKQTYTKLEILLIDDGSTDTSPALCEQLAAQDPRIVVIHQNNAGLSAARNTGITHARGDMFVFVDSDDACVSTMVEELYTLHQKYDADIAVCAYREIETQEEFDAALHQGFEQKEAPGGGKAWFGDKVFDYFYEFADTSIWPAVQCNKLFARSIFDGLRFEEGKLHEDEFIIHLELDNASCVASTSKELYLYRHHASSITRNQALINKVHLLQALKNRVLFYEKKQLKQYAIEECYRARHTARKTLCERNSYDGSWQELLFIAATFLWCEIKILQLNPKEELNDMVKRILRRP